MSAKLIAKACFLLASHAEALYHGDDTRFCCCCFLLSRVADNALTGLVAKKESSEWRLSHEMRAHRKTELQELEALIKSSSGSASVLQKIERKLRAQIEADDAEVTLAESKTCDYLREAVRYYVNAMIAGAIVVRASRLICSGSCA